MDSVAGESDTTNNCSGKVTVTVTNNLATGAPTISGTAQVGETLTVDTSGIADADGLSSATFSYQWISSRDTDIHGGTDANYILVDADAGKTIKVRVSFTDDAGHEETLTSSATDPVAASPDSGPAVAVELSPSGSVEEGMEIALTMSFANLESDSDTSDTDYIFRADVVDADACEGGGMGRDRYMYKVDEDPEVRAGTISASCTPGDYTVEVSISSPGNVELASATADFTVNAPGQQQPEPPSTDTTLSGLTLSDVTLAFASATTDYTVSVANGVDETTVTPTTNDDGATYMVKLDGVADDDEVIPLSVGSNTITIEVTAEDGNATQTYTVTVTRAEPLSTDATLNDLALSGVDFGAFDSATTGYTASVANDVDETTVTPTTNDGGATYEIKLGGVADADGVVPLAVGSNAITIEVTAEDGNSAKTYTVTVTRAALPAPGPAVAVALSPSGSVAEGTEIALTMSFANLESDSDTSDTDYIFRADVVNADACEGGGMGLDRYMYKVDEDPEVRGGVISASCAPGDYTVEVSISSPGNVELASATADFTVATPAQQQPPPEPPASTDATLSNLTLSGIDFGAFDSATTGYTASVANDVTQTAVTPTVNDDGATYAIKLGGVTDDDGVIPLAVGSNVITIEVTAEDGNTAKTYKVTITRAEPDSEPEVSTDATLSGLTLSGIDFGAFNSATTGYTASVANDVAETTVTPTTNDDGATYEIKLGGVADAYGVVPLAVGSNVITIEVTAEDRNTAKTYTVTVTRDTPTVSGPAVSIELSPSGSVAEGTEITVTMSFANLESDTDTSDTDYIFRADVVNADACEGGGMGNDRYMYKVDEDPEVRTGSISTSCAPGDYTVEISISSPGNAELASATADFTVNAPSEQEQPEPPASTDATLSNLALSNVDFGVFTSSTTGYTASVANYVTQTAVTPTVNNDGATYAIKLGGVTDADGVIPLAVGSNVITVEVTAEDGNATRTYTVTVTRAAPPPSTDATLSSLTLSDAPFTFASDTTSYDVNVANRVDETTVRATANDGGASYVMKLGGVTDADGTVELSVGGNAVSVVVTAEDGETTKTYTVTVTRADPPPPEPVEPESTGERSAWLEQNPENKPFVGEWQHFTLRGSGLDKVHLSVNVIGFGGAPSSTGAVGYGTASPLPAVGEVCGDAYYSGYQMSVDATFSLVGCREGTVIIELLDPGNDWALLKRYTVTVNAGP